MRHRDRLQHNVIQLQARVRIHDALGRDQVAVAPAEVRWRWSQPIWSARTCSVWLFDAYKKKGAGHGIAEGGVFDGDE